MKISSDNHVHTSYSRNGHAKGSIEEIVQAARRAKLTQVLITDHGPGHFLFGIKRTAFPEVRAEIDRLNKVYDDIEILFGCEANVISYDGRIDLTKSEIEYLDRVNVGFHYGIIPVDLKSILLFLVLNPLSRIFPPLRRYVIKKNTDALIAIIHRYQIYVITHPGSKVKLDIPRLAKECAAVGTALEINSSHGDMDEESIRLALPEGVLFSMGSDAHSPRRVGDLAQSILRAENCKVPVDRLINRHE